MKQYLAGCLAVVVLLALASTRGVAQRHEPIDPAVFFPPDCLCGPFCAVDPCSDRAFDEHFQQWVLSLDPAARRGLMTTLLVGVHPLMAFLPTESPVVLPCQPMQHHYQIMPFVVQWAGHDGPDKLGWNCVEFVVGQFGNGRINLDCTIDLLECSIATHEYGVACPYLITRGAPPVPPVVSPPDVLTNLQRLLQAGHLLHCGEEFGRDGRFREAVECFQEIHRLVPGSNLEARAGAATQDLLVKVYGTATEKGTAEEPCEPDRSEIRPPPPMPCCTACVKAAAAPAAKSACAKPRTIVYPVGDLLGKGKETGLDDLDGLMNVIAATVDPKSWADNGGDGTIDTYYRSRAVVIRQTQEVHDQIAELLAGLREARAQCDNGEAKPRRSPTADRAAKVTSDAGCCEECCADKKCPKSSPSVVARKACGEEPCPPLVLTLPTWEAPEAAKADGQLELVVEAGPGQEPVAARSDGFRCTAGSACAEAGTTPEGPRLRWQIALGPVTVLIRYEHRELSVGFGAQVEAGSGTEESETPQ